MKNRRRLLTSCFILLFFVAGALAAQDAGDLLSRINNLRASLGLSPYRLNGALNAAAQSQAQWMAETGNVSHSRPDGSTPRSRAQSAGYSSSLVSENIYMGTLATVDTAWTFWINSAIHYAGLTNPGYQDVGIGIARSQSGTAYVLVFGNPDGSLPVSLPRNNNQSAAPPSFIVGVDAHGNIMHEIQPGDTLGDIALLYGYTWDDLPYMMELNGLTQNDIRQLEVGSVFLVPPHAGTYTPTPVSDADLTMTAEAVFILSATPTASATLPPTPSPVSTETPLPTATLHIATAAAPEAVLMALPAVTVTSPPESTPAAVIASVDTPVVVSGEAGSSVIVRSQTSPWLIVAIVVQVGVVLLAAIEFIRRARR